MPFQARNQYVSPLSGVHRELSAQALRSPDRTEVLFIAQHQTSELWMEIMMHWLGAAMACIAKDDLGSAFKMLDMVLLPEIRALRTEL